FKYLLSIKKFPALKFRQSDSDAPRKLFVRQLSETASRIFVFPVSLNLKSFLSSLSCPTK
ncbi:MAG: hypothetical protein K1X49_12015, partial [Saprospiraceae bacterium]|nr:hypothetical protein [Saprospiraceae bacterium]